MGNYRPSAQGEEKAFFAKRIVPAVAGAPLDERDVSRSDWKTASFGRGSARGCRVLAGKRRIYETNSTRPDNLLLGASASRECPWLRFGSPQVTDFARVKCVICREAFTNEVSRHERRCRLRNEPPHWDRPRGSRNGLVGEALCEGHFLDASRQAKTTKRTVRFRHFAERIPSPFLRI